MTGFGRSEYSDGRRNITYEMRAVNHRYCRRFRISAKEIPPDPNGTRAGTAAPAIRSRFFHDGIISPYYYTRRGVMGPSRPPPDPATPSGAAGPGPGTPGTPGCRGRPRGTGTTRCAAGRTTGRLESE